MIRFAPVFSIGTLAQGGESKTANIPRSEKQKLYYRWSEAYRIDDVKTLIVNLCPDLEMVKSERKVVNWKSNVESLEQRKPGNCRDSMVFVTLHLRSEDLSADSEQITVIRLSEDTSATIVGV